MVAGSLGASSGTGSTEVGLYREMELMKKNHFPQVFLVGPSFETIANNYTFTRYFPDTDTLIEYLKVHEIRHAFILIKGSRGNKLERITEYL